MGLKLLVAYQHKIVQQYPFDIQNPESCHWQLYREKSCKSLVMCVNLLLRKNSSILYGAAQATLGFFDTSYVGMRLQYGNCGTIKSTYQISF